MANTTIPNIARTVLDGSGMNFENTMPVGSEKPMMLLLGTVPIPFGGKLVLCVFVAHTPSELPLKSNSSMRLSPVVAPRTPTRMLLPPGPRARLAGNPKFTSGPM